VRTKKPDSLWAVIKITGGAETWQAPGVAFPEEVVLDGFFDEAWEQ